MVIPIEIENELWANKTLSSENPVSLLNALLWKCGTCFTLRGGDELRGIRTNNIKFEVVSDTKMRVIYTKLVDKNHQGGLRDNKPPKIVRQLENPIEVNSFTSLYNLYLSQLPATCDLNKSLWYQPNYTGWRAGIWYKDQAVGANKLGKFVKTLMKPYADEGYTNHSLHVTTINKLIDANVDPVDITQRTCHFSLGTIMKYRKENDKTTGHVSDVITAPSIVNDSPQSSQSCTDPEAQVQKMLNNDEIDKWVKGMTDNEMLNVSRPESSFNLPLTQLLDESTSCLLDESTSCDAKVNTYVVIGTSKFSYSMEGKIVFYF